MPRRRPTIWTNPTYGVLVWIVTAVLLVSIAGMGVMALWAANPQTEAQKEFSASMKIGFQMSLGALIGLLGGRAARPDPELPAAEKVRNAEVTDQL
jgi:hypothetical protein